MVETRTPPEQQEQLPPMKKSDAPNYWLSWQAIFSGSMFIYMYLPIFVLGFYSFNESAYSSSWQGFSLKWYAILFRDGRVFAALQKSLFVALVAVGISAVVGTMMAVGLAKYRFPGRTLYVGVSYLPLIVPDIAIAVATLVFLAVIGLPSASGRSLPPMWFLPSLCGDRRILTPCRPGSQPRRSSPRSRCDPHPSVYQSLTPGTGPRNFGWMFTGFCVEYG